MSNDDTRADLGCIAWITAICVAAAVFRAVLFSCKHKACMLQHPGTPSWTCWVNP